MNLGRTGPEDPNGLHYQYSCASLRIPSTPINTAPPSHFTYLQKEALQKFASNFRVTGSNIYIFTKRKTSKVELFGSISPVRFYLIGSNSSSS